LLIRVARESSEAEVISLQARRQSALGRRRSWQKSRQQRG
jgi:hypothetical protein